MNAGEQVGNYGITDEADNAYDYQNAQNNADRTLQRLLKPQRAFTMRFDDSLFKCIDRYAEQKCHQKTDQDR